MSKEQKDLEIKANELGKKLDDDEIEAATGGGKCFCLVAGYGHCGDEEETYYYDKACICVVIGLSLIGNQDFAGRCQCAIVGNGF